MPLHALPGVPPQPVYARPLVSATHVLLHQVQPIHRHVELLAFGVLDLEKLPPKLLPAEQRCSQIPTDAVVNVDHVVATLQVPQVGEERMLLGSPQPSWALPHTKNLTIGHKSQAKVRYVEPGGEPSDAKGKGGKLAVSLRLT